MLKSALLMSSLGVAAILPASVPAGANQPYPAPTDCIRSDQVVCTYRIMSEKELAAGYLVRFETNAGLPAPERIELHRLDTDHVALFVYFPVERDLQGIAL